MGSSSFSVLPTPGTPVVVEAGEEVDFTVLYDPKTPAGMERAVIRIASNDPGAPFVDLDARGTLGTPALATAIADQGSFGNVCVGSFRDEELTINNTGACPLLIGNISSSSGEFMAPGVASYPLVVNPGSSLEITVRFQPASFGAKSGTLTLFSNDPAGAHRVAVSGTAPPPRLTLIMADSGDFGPACVGSFTDKPLTLANSGPCTLTISNIVSSSAEFLAPEVLAFPLTIAAGVSIQVPIRFQPASFGPKAGSISILSDDPGGARTVSVSGNAPSGKIAVTGSLCFGGVKACCRAERTLTICNTGDCKLHVTSVAFKRKNRHWKLIHNPFPATLHPGSCLSVVVRYNATEKCPRCCELVIISDDPATPVKTLDVMAYTIWNQCRCKECCDDCKKGCCQKSQSEHCCEGRADDCCEDDDDDDED
jgi:hypothetical protein